MTPRFYVVQKGDSLWGIARHFDCKVEDLAARNGLTGSRKHHIQVGQRIYLPGGDDTPPDLRLHIRIIGLSSKPLRHVPVLLTFDDSEAEAKTNDDGWLDPIEIQDHGKGLKVEYQDYANEWEEIFDVQTLPLGEKVLEINVLTDLLKGTTVRKKGVELISDAKVPEEIKKKTPQPPSPFHRGGRPVASMPCALR